MDKKAGFTLIELMLVIVILGILAALLSGNFISSLKRGRDARRKGDLEQIQKALEMYYEDNRAYPSRLETENAQLCHPDGCSTKIYMTKIPRDPSDNELYEYIPATDNGSYGLYACLENSQQILPYVPPLTSSPSLSSNCGQCKDHDQNPAACIWAVSSSNVNP